MVFRRDYHWGHISTTNRKRASHMPIVIGGTISAKGAMRIGIMLRVQKDGAEERYLGVNSRAERKNSKKRTN